MTKSIVEAEKTSKALQVLAILSANPKLTTKIACETVGISVDVYRYWIAKDPEALEAFRELISEIERNELASIFLADEVITNRLITDAIDPLTESADALGIKMYLDARGGHLSRKHRAAGSDSGREFLQGVEMKEAESRFAASAPPTMELNVSKEKDGSVTIKATQPEIIDMED
jgi:hypothetical protein